MNRHDEPPVVLVAADGTEYQFRLGIVLAFEGQTYAVLIELEPDAQGEEQLLITRVHEDEAHNQTFEVVSDMRVVDAVFAQYTAISMGDTIQRFGEMYDAIHGDGAPTHMNGATAHEHHHGDHHEGQCGCDHDHRVH